MSTLAWNVAQNFISRRREKSFCDWFISGMYLSLRTCPTRKKNVPRSRLSPWRSRLSPWISAAFIFIHRFLYIPKIRSAAWTPSWSLLLIINSRVYLFLLLIWAKVVSIYFCLKGRKYSKIQSFLWLKKALSIWDRYENGHFLSSFPLSWKAECRRGGGLGAGTPLPPDHLQQNPPETRPQEAVDDEISAGIDSQEKVTNPVHVQ